MRVQVGCGAVGMSMCSSKCVSSDIQAEWKHEPTNVPAGWPTEGCIDIRGFSLRYRHDLDPAIRNITINIKGGEKVCGQGST